MSTKEERSGYCSTCGDWNIDCVELVVYGAPEKVCKQCLQQSRMSDLA